MSQNTQVATIRQETGKFVATLQSPDYQQKFKAMLPTDVPVDRFTNVIIRAVQENPDLMKPSTDKASLFLACQRAAQDGLIPDGKEGALVMYGQRVQWQPMIGGLRKNLARAGFDLRTGTVYEHDEFDYELGDEPRITHKPPKLGQDRGKVIGFYAIATGPDGEKYRDVMSKADVDYVKSKAKSGNVWSSWYNAMGEKTVGRRLVKQLPIVQEDERLREMLKNDDENFDLDRQPAPQRSSVAERVQAAATGQPAPEPEPDECVIDADWENVDTAADVPDGDDPLASD